MRREETGLEATRPGFVRPEPNSDNEVATHPRSSDHTSPTFLEISNDLAIVMSRSDSLSPDARSQIMAIVQEDGR
jgi:hypothetical protein